MRQAIIFLCVIFIMYVLLSSCSIVTRVKRDIDVYCDKTSDLISKQIALKAIRIKYPGYPSGGICSILIHKEDV